jgi:hypothetical protein
MKTRFTLPSQPPCWRRRLKAAALRLEGLPGETSSWGLGRRLSPSARRVERLWLVWAVVKLEDVALPKLGGGFEPPRIWPWILAWSETGLTPPFPCSVIEPRPAEVVPKVTNGFQLLGPPEKKVVRELLRVLPFRLPLRLRPKVFAMLRSLRLLSVLPLALSLEGLTLPLCVMDCARECIKASAAAQSATHFLISRSRSRADDSGVGVPLSPWLVPGRLPGFDRGGCM